MEKLEARIQMAMSADRDGIRGMLSDPSDKVVMALINNINITEDELLVLARRRNIPGEALGGIAGRRFTAEGYKVRVALVNNPRTPRRVALGLLRELRLGDMAYVTHNKQLPTELRQAAEGMLKEKLPALPAGIKIGLARQVSEEVVKALLTTDNPMLIKACFENPRMKEAVVLWAINHRKVPARVIEHISMDLKWSSNYSVRFAILRNPHTPVERAMEFAQGLKSMDQRFLYNDPAVPVAVKVSIEIELERKGQPLSPPREEGRVIGIIEDEELLGDV
jgi:hypothetical protein